MGAMQNNGKQGTRKSKARGTVKNADRLQAFASSDDFGSASWSNADPKRLHAVVAAITEMGGAITLGLSRDMGAHSLTLLLDGSRKTLWFNGGADLNEELDGVKDTLDSMSITA